MNRQFDISKRSLSTIMIALCVSLLYLFLNCGTDAEKYFSYLNTTAVTIGAALAGYYIGKRVMTKLPFTGWKKWMLVLAAAICGILLFLYILTNLFGISWIWLEAMVIRLLIMAWPLLLSGLAEMLAVALPKDRKALQMGIYILAVFAVIALDLMLSSRQFSAMGGLRPDHILYFLIVAVVFFVYTYTKRSTRTYLVVSIVGTIGIAASVLAFSSRGREVISYLAAGWMGQESAVDWAGYRMAAAKAYWFHDFDMLRTRYHGEGYTFKLDTDGLIKLAHDYGSWTSIVLSGLVLCVCAGLLWIYRRDSDFNREGSMIANSIPYLVLAYGIRTFLAVMENMFLFCVWKFELPFTGLGMAELFFLVILLQHCLFEREKALDPYGITGLLFRRAVVVLMVFACVSICFAWTQDTKRRLEEEALHEKWYYNGRKEEQVNQNAEEYLSSKTGKEFVICGAANVLAADTEVVWGITDDDILYIGGHGAVEYIADSYHKAMKEGAADCHITRAVVLPGIERLGREAFADLPELQEVELASSVVDVGQDAFCRCGALECVRLQGFRTQVYSDAFWECSSQVRIIQEASYGDVDMPYRTKLQFEE